MCIIDSYFHYGMHRITPWITNKLTLQLKFMEILQILVTTANDEDEDK